MYLYAPLDALQQRAEGLGRQLGVGRAQRGREVGHARHGLVVVHERRHLVAQRVARRRATAARAGAQAAAAVHACSRQQIGYLLSNQLITLVNKKKYYIYTNNLNAKVAMFVIFALIPLCNFFFWFITHFKTKN